VRKEEKQDLARPLRRARLCSNLENFVGKQRVQAALIGKRVEKVAGNQREEKKRLWRDASWGNWSVIGKSTRKEKLKRYPGGETKT